MCIFLKIFENSQEIVLVRSQVLGPNNDKKFGGFLKVIVKGTKTSQIYARYIFCWLNCVYDDI
jgi:hypothetical protein